MEFEIPKKIRAKAIYDAGKTTPAAIARGACVSKRTAYRYISDFKKGKSCERKKYPKRKNYKITSKLQQKVIKKAQDRRHIWSTRAIGSSIGISHTTTRQVLIEKGIKYQHYNKQLKLTEENKEERLAFAREMKKRESDWGFVMFTDECSFWTENMKPSKVWTNDPVKEEGTGTHGVKVHCWGAISSFGALPIEIFEENLTAHNYINIINRRLPYLNELYPDGYIWQQDGSGVHRADCTKKFIMENMPQVLTWPAYSPDISPIENVWSWLKGEVAKDCPRSVRQLKVSIKKHWNRIDQEFLAPFINSMPERMKLLIRNKGDRIKC